MWPGQRKKLLSAPFPEERRRLAARCALYVRLPEPDRRELEGHINVFLAEKRFEGCDGVVITEEMRVVIAAQACLLLLHRRTDDYPLLRTVLVYPSHYYAATTRPVGLGVLEESWQARAGESWPAGAVVLAWDEVVRGAADPATGNVVLHEFAHQLDYENGGVADGIPALGEGVPFRDRPQRQAAWVAVMRSEYEQLRARVQRGEDGVLRGYGATSPAEFFAVATEGFFGRPGELRREHPALYGELKWYYRQDPAGWTRGGYGL